MNIILFRACMAARRNISFTAFVIRKFIRSTRRRSLRTFTTRSSCCERNPRFARLFAGSEDKIQTSPLSTVGLTLARFESREPRRKLGSQLHLAELTIGFTSPAEAVKYRALYRMPAFIIRPQARQVLEDYREGFCGGGVRRQLV